MSAIQNKTAGKFVCETPTPKAGVTLPCPRCGVEHASIAVHLGELDGDNAFHCRECSEEFSFDSIRRLVNAWAKVLPRVAALAAVLDDDLAGIDEAGDSE